MSDTKMSHRGGKKPTDKEAKKLAKGILGEEITNDINLIIPDEVVIKDMKITPSADPVIFASQAAYDELVKEFFDFVASNEKRLHSIREYLKTVKHDGRKLYGDEDLDKAFGKGWCK